ncbi:DUF1254 domain-containing protein [Bradyrhizobium sp. CIAT3101]|uniref:DUF1254 domain-containing protein n=1 Tax=Bradyrhizobium sp. CIAT3101 TaxID=439387 RepID=UPI0024B0D1B0|nr:DUF1254 domain-containing protein [Bradyrhizobium sp. CIAT3101]WFU79523.1 DUF1254 domain-containing protein [Bradyrhizobium sp. CIAT3101]
MTCSRNAETTRTLLRAASVAAAFAVSAAGSVATTTAHAQQSSAPAAQSTSAEDTLTIAQEAYVYLYPMILMDLTRKQLTNLDPKTNPLGGPANAFTHIRAFPTADMRTVVRPNFDTLYSSAWLDLTGGPMVVSTADTGGRYFLLPMLDMWTDVFAVPGKRTNGTGAASFALVPPGWAGTLPPDVERINAPTSYVWIIGRTQTNGVKDYDAVHKIQDGYKITALADWGKAPSKVAQKIDPSVDTKTEPLRMVAEMPAAEFFKYGAELMKQNPPHMTDWSNLARMKRIGIEPGTFDSTKASPDVLAQGAAAGLKRMYDKAPTLARVTNGWQMNTDTMGVYGDFYLKRAIVALVGLGANQPEDAIYPLNVADAAGKPVTAEKKYVLHFDKDELPPVSAFWSLTMYDEEGYQVANPINRFAIGDRDALAYNTDGSLDLYVQNETPGADKEANWLPAPKSGKLGLTLRLYGPRPQAIDGRWNPPAIEQAAGGTIGRK